MTNIEGFLRKSPWFVTLFYIVSGISLLLKFCYLALINRQFAEIIGEIPKS